ncbi:hypothetical protein BHUM_05411 [Candidatus Burkholderia humilis]|nr:hypothetical protein BHUM_05411 [Candidatus Burkholderia humilis]
MMLCSRIRRIHYSFSHYYLTQGHTTRHSFTGSFMDLREIQRLHAQFAPDSMTIDLPRQIAALPAPTAFESDTPSMSRITRAPLIRSCAAPMVVAILVALTGIGAAKIYRAVSTDVAPQMSSREKTVLSKTDTATLSKAASETAARPIDATPARPVVIASVLDVNDLGHEPMHPPTSGLPELTADQFRTSINSAASTGSTNTGGPTKPALSVSDQTTTAAASPIRQIRREADAPRASEVEPPQIAQAAPQAAQGGSKPRNTGNADDTRDIGDARRTAPVATPTTGSSPDTYLSTPRRAPTRHTSPRWRAILCRAKYQTRAD